MPSKVKPEWGKAAPGLGSKPLVTDEQVRHLGALASVSPEQYPAFHEAVFDVAHSFEIDSYRCDIKTGVAARRAGLEQLKALSSQLRERLQQVDLTTRQRIVACYPLNPFPHELDAPPDLERRRQKTKSAIPQDRWMLLKRDAEHVERIVRSVTIALAELRREKGAKGGRPEILLTLKESAVRLSAIWERFTGESYFTGRAQKGRRPARAFVEATLKMLKPDASDANISIALREAAAEPARELRKQKPLKNRE